MRTFKLYAVQKVTPTGLIEKQWIGFARKKKKARKIAISTKHMNVVDTDMVRVTEIKGDYAGPLEEVIEKEIGAQSDKAFKKAEKKKKDAVHQY